MDGPSYDARQRPPKYEDEDTTPTTKKELRGWYAYALAAEVYAVCGVGSFLPVLMEQLARERGTLWSDRSKPCIDRTASQSPSHSLFVRASNYPRADNSQCVVRFLGGDITTASFAMYTFSTAVLIQALTLVSFSSVADYGHNRKKFLLGFAFTGAATAMLFLFIVPEIYFLAPILVIISVTCLGSSFVLLNSFLPLLVSNHPNSHDLRRGSTTVALESLNSDGRAQEIGSNSDPFERDTTSDFSIPDSSDLKLSTIISSKGVGIGYASAVFVQCLCIIFLWLTAKSIKSSTLPLRLILFFTGVWWSVFSIPSLIYLRPRPGPPLPLITSNSAPYNFFISIRFAWSSLYRTLKLAIKLRQILIFLVAWFILSDAIGTISAVAILFARTELHMTTVPIALLSITATLSGLAGALFWPFIARRFHLSSKSVILICILIMEIIPLYGLLGFLQFFQNLGWGGLQQAWEIFPLAFIHGMVMGGLNSYCRSFYGLLIPSGKEAAFYALFAVTDKGSSAIGPAVAGRIIDVTGGIRPAFWFLMVLVLLPLPFIWRVDVESGRRDVNVMEKGTERDVDVDDTDLDIRDDEIIESERLMKDHERID